MSLNSIFNGLCQPAQLYFILAVFSFTFQVIAILFDKDNVRKGTLLPILLHFVIYVIVTVIWVWLLNGMCKAGGIFNKISWFIALFPIIVFLMMLMGVINALSEELVDGGLQDIVSKCGH
tara:strand:+ start:1831 stop:2190 length:360 start_codon:yes stop_codon:yes gene_type:complete